MIQIILHTSYVNLKFEVNVFDDYTFCNNDDDQLILFDNKSNESVRMDDIPYHISRSKSDSETLQNKPRSLKF